MRATGPGRPTALSTVDNPLKSANLKAKKLKALLQRQNAAQKKGPLPFIEALVFCSALDLSLELQGNARTRVCLRDKNGTSALADRPGILAAVTRREGCQGLDPTPRGRTTDRPPSCWARPWNRPGFDLRSAIAR